MNSRRDKKQNLLGTFKTKRLCFGLLKFQRACATFYIGNERIETEMRAPFSLKPSIVKQ